VGRGVDPRVFFSVRWADWLGAFGARRLAAVAKSLDLYVEDLVEYMAKSPPRAVARLLCRLANNRRHGGPGGYDRLQMPHAVGVE